MKRFVSDFSRVKWLRNIAIAMTVLFFIMFIPAVCYSLNTPFAFVDDLNDSLYVAILETTKGFLYWAKTTFIGVPQGGRYRPLFEFHNAAAWLALGFHPALHHALRWVEWLTGMLFWNMALWRLAHTLRHRAKTDTPELTRLMPMLILNVFVCFFPNQPVARLGPQELHTFVALGLLFLGTMRLLTEADDAGKAAVAARTGMIILGYAGLSMAKEVNVAFMAMFCLFLVGVSIVRRRGWLLVAVIPAAGLLGYTAWRIHVASVAADYGRIDLGIPLVMRNLRWLAHDAFQSATSPVFFILILASLVFAGVRIVGLWRQSGVSRDVECLVFSLGMTLSFCAAMTVSWLPALRYFQPLVPLLGWHLAWGFMELDRSVLLRSVPKGVLTGLALVFLGGFVLANYYNFLLQFAVQHHVRQVEQRVLSTMEQQLRAGKPVAVCVDRQDPEIELAYSVKTYFEHILPLCRGERLDLRVLSSPQTDAAVMLASRRKLDREHWRLTETLTCEPAPGLLQAAKRVSSLLQGRRYPYVVQDAGTHDLDYAWYFYESAGGCTER